MGITSTNPYGTGGKVLNSTPYLQYFLQTRAHQAAQNAALDNHFNKLNESITPAGMRQKDIDGFLKRVNENREFYNQNKKFIQNPTTDNGKAYSEYMARHQANLAYANGSKQNVEISKQAAPLFMNPANRERLAQQSYDAYKLHDLPLDDPNYKPFDLAAVDFNPKELDAAAQANLINNSLKHIPKDDLGVTTTKLPGMQIANATVQGYKPESKKAMLSVLENLAYSNPSFAKAARDAYKDPSIEGDAHGRLDAMYKELTGKPIQSKEQLFAAEKLNQYAHENTKLHTAADWLGRDNRNFEQQVALKNMGLRDAKDLARYRKGLTDTAKDGQINVADNKIEEQFANGSPRKFYIGGKEYKGRAVSIPPELAKKYSGSHTDKDGYDVQPTEFVITNDKKFLVPMYKVGGKENADGGYSGMDTKEREMIPIPSRYKDDLNTHYLTKTQIAKGGDVTAEDGEVPPSLNKKTRSKASAKPASGVKWH